MQLYANPTIDGVNYCWKHFIEKLAGNKDILKWDVAVEVNEHNYQVEFTPTCCDEEMREIR